MRSALRKFKNLWLGLSLAAVCQLSACQMNPLQSPRSESEEQALVESFYPVLQASPFTDEVNPSLTWGMAFPPLETEIPRGFDRRPLDFTLETMKDLKLQHLRFTEDWKQRETSVNGFDWTSLDARMEALKGFKVMLTIQSNGPEWRCSQSVERGCVIEDLNAFESYLGQLLQRYPEAIERIQFGNEMLNPTFFPGQPSAYLLAQQRFAQVVRRLRPELPLVLGGFSAGALRRFAFCEGQQDLVLYENGRKVEPGARDSFCLRREVQDENFGLQQILQNADYDQVDLHLYDDPEYWPLMYQSVQEELERIAEHKDREVPAVIVSEFGGPALPLEPDDEAYQARRLGDYMDTLQRLPGLQAAYFFKLFPDSIANTPHRSSTLFRVGLPPQRKAAYEVFRKRSQQAATDSQN